MEESIYDWMERTRFVDLLLMWCALLLPLAVAGLAFALRGRPAVTCHRHHWVMGLLAAPLLLLLWRVYNAIADHYGLDSVVGFAVNAAIFAVSAVLLALAGHLLGAFLGGRGEGGGNAPPPAENPADTP
jgi:4-amino-4-deoxy-L-arabinose transferase-like glycosyltransferase